MKFNVKDLNRLKTVLKIHLVFSENFDFFFTYTCITILYILKIYYLPKIKGVYDISR